MPDTGDIFHGELNEKGGLNRVFPQRSLADRLEKLRLRSRIRADQPEADAPLFLDQELHRDLPLVREDLTFPESQQRLRRFRLFFGAWLGFGPGFGSGLSCSRHVLSQVGNQLFQDGLADGPQAPEARIAQEDQGDVQLGDQQKVGRDAGHAPAVAEGLVLCQLGPGPAQPVLVCLDLGIAARFHEVDGLVLDDLFLAAQLVLEVEHAEPEQVASRTVDGRGSPVVEIVKGDELFPPRVALGDTLLRTWLQKDGRIGHAERSEDLLIHELWIGAP